MNKKGFTLIELLVVIAIIGILSSIAIVYLGDARKKANDAKVSSNVTTASTQIELDRANGTNSNGTTFDASVDLPLITGKLGVHPCGGAWLQSYDTDYSNVAIASSLCTTVSGVAEVFCADSSGYRGTSTKAISAFNATNGDGTGKCQ